MFADLGAAGFLCCATCLPHSLIHGTVQRCAWVTAVRSVGKKPWAAVGRVANSWMAKGSMSMAKVLVLQIVFLLAGPDGWESPPSFNYIGPT